MSVAAVAAVSTFGLRKTQRSSSSFTSVLALGRNPAGKDKHQVWLCPEPSLCIQLPWPPQVLQALWVISVGLEMSQTAASQAGTCI